MTDIVPLTAMPEASERDPTASLYVSHRDIPAFHQKTYPKRWPDRSAVVSQARPPQIAGGADLSYQQFVEGDFTIRATGATA